MELMELMELIDWCGGCIVLWIHIYIYTYILFSIFL